MLLPNFSFDQIASFLLHLLILLAGLTSAYNGDFCFLEAFIHLTLKLNQVKPSSFTYITNASLDKS
jgi:hypothetical protein